MSSTAAQARARAPRIDQASVAKARLTVVPRLRSRTPRVPFFVLVALVAVSGVVGLLLFNTSMQQATFEASALEAEAAELKAREHALTIELEQLRDPQRIAEEAQRIGMVLPAGSGFVDVEGGRIGRRPAAAGGETLSLVPPAAVKPAELDPPPRVVWAPERDSDGRRDRRGSARRDEERREQHRGEARRR